MSILAGVVSRGNDFPVNEDMCSEIRTNISRNTTDTVQEFKRDRSFLAKVDLGVFGSPAICSDFDSSVSMISGEPLLQFSADDTGRERVADLKLLHQGWQRTEFDIMKTARGTYNAVFLDYLSNDVFLMADKLGVRSLYFWVSKEFVVFASALRILEQLSFVPKKMDVTGICEAVTFGEPLGERTSYEDIFMLQAAEIVKVTSSEVERSRYWSWDSIPLSNCSLDKNLKQSYDDFSRAINFRLRDEKTTVAFLSGGLDSRVIVGALREQEVTVHTLNFAPKGTQDQVFGAELATAIGTLHQEVFVDSEKNIDRRMAAASVWENSEALKKQPPERSRLVWSGDGGSVGLGHVYLNQKAVNFAKECNLDSSINALLDYNKWQMPGAKVFRSPYSTDILKIPFSGVKCELQKLKCDEPGRDLYLFLMLNDQRRHLVDHFENIDLYRIEFQLPFFDGPFLETICSMPIDYLLRHSFYVQWLDLFSPPVSSIPWQAYPGHIPCPIPIPEGLRYQWGSYFDVDVAKKLKIEKMNKVKALMKSEAFPGKIFSRNKLRLVSILTRLGIQDFSYVFNMLEKFSACHVKCDVKKN